MHAKIAFPDNIECVCFHACKVQKNEEKISVTLERSCKEVRSEHQFMPFTSDLWVTRPLVWLFYVSGMTLENPPLLFLFLSIWRKKKKANTNNRRSLPFKSREIFIIVSPSSGVIDEQSFLSNFFTECIFNFSHTLSFLLLSCCLFPVSVLQFPWCSLDIVLRPV